MSGQSQLGTKGVDRRTVLRAAAWTTPAVVVVTASPAFACSTTDDLAVGSFTAHYRNHANANTVVPSEIVVSSTVSNTGTQATTSYVRTVFVPGDLFDTVTSSTPAGYSAPTVTGGPAAGWTLTYVRAANLGAGEIDSFLVTLTVGGTSSSPYRGWRGVAFDLGGTVNGGACGVVSVADQVEATPNTDLSIDNWSADRSSNSSTLTMGGSSTRVENDGRKAVGPVTLTVTIPRTSQGLYSTAPVNPTNVSSGWQFVGPMTASDDAWTYTFVTTGAHLAPDAFGTSSSIRRTPTFSAQISLTGPLENTPRVSIGVVASAVGANNDSDSDSVSGVSSGGGDDDDD